MIGDKFEKGHMQDQNAARIEFADKVLDRGKSSNTNNLFQHIIEHLPDQIYLKDTQGKFLLCNAPVAQNAGCMIPEEVIGKTDFDFYPFEVAERFFNDEKEILQSAVALINHEEAYTNRRTNCIMWNLTTKIPIQDESNVVVGLLGINRDITDIKNALDDKKKILSDLQKRNLELETFTHIVSHNLRAPVANILGLLALVMNENIQHTEDSKMIIDKINLSAKRLDQIIHELNGILHQS
jgi:PAS domain S-box-containing protein